MSTISLQDAPALSHDVTEENITGAKEEFEALLGAPSVLVDETECRNRSHTQWSAAAPSQNPALVLFPSSTDETSAIMKICHRRRIPVTAYCGGSSLVGALAATRGGICIDFNRMDKIMDLHTDDMDVVVQPAVSWRTLGEILAPEGLLFPPDPGHDAKIGGMIAMNCSGTNAYRYGPMKNWVISLTAVLADGTVVKTRRRPRKSSAGYDLTRLLVGSEGTLGLVTEAVLKLTPIPPNQRVAIGTFPTVHDAVRTSIALQRSGHVFDAMELLDEECLKAINISKRSERVWEEKTTLFLKFSGVGPMVGDVLEVARKAAESNSCIKFETTDDESTSRIWWEARTTAGKSIISTKKSPTDLFIPSDVAVPVSRIADLVQEAKRLANEVELPHFINGHLGDGNIHFVVLCPLEKKDYAYEIMGKLQDKGLELDGTVTGEHGVGLHLRDKLVNELGQPAVDMMRKVKLALDPSCILNCDKVLRLES